MKNKSLFLVALSVLLVSCIDDDNNTAAPQLKLNLTGLENLGANYKYEGWVVVNGAPVTTGTFTVNDDGVLSQTTFDVAAATLANRKSIV